MNTVQAFVDRQIGDCNWRNYDTAIKRLRCIKEDDFNRLLPTEEENHSEPPMFACKFAQSSSFEHILALANEDGQIVIHNTYLKPNDERSMYDKRYGRKVHHNAIFDIAWMFGHMKLVSVSGDHTARLLDVANGDLTEERIFHGHTRSVKTVAFRKDDPAVFATGARDGAIFVWDTRARHSYYITAPDRVISNSHNILSTPGSGSKFRQKILSTQGLSGANSVTSLVFQDDMTLISCGAGDGAIKVWDLRKNYGVNNRGPLPKCVLPYMGNSSRNGFSNLLVDGSGVKLYANCMDNSIYCYNIATYLEEPVMSYVGHQNTSFFVKSSISADGKYLISGSGDQNAYIWDINLSTPIVTLTGHIAEVTCVAWCQKGETKIVTCADDMKHKIWRIHDETACDWSVDSRGKAVAFENIPEYKLLNTPSSKRRASITTPHSQRKRSRICEKCQLLTPGSSQSSENCENCNFSLSRSSKRTASQAELSPNESKRQQTERSGPRRLFGNLQELEASSSKESDVVLATILEETSPITSDTIFSPTANLPNFVVDGNAPHLKNFSPQKKKDKDWLTKMRIEQSLRSQMEDLSRPKSSPKRRLSETSVSPKPAANSAKKKKTSNRAQSPLLKYFTVTSHSRSCDNQYSSVSLVKSPVPSELRHRN